MTARFACSVAVQFPKSSDQLRCNCEVALSEIRFATTPPRAVSLTADLHLDEFARKDGFAMCSSDGEIEVSCTNPDDQTLLTSVVLQGIWEDVIRISSEAKDKLEWRHAAYRGTLHSACVLEDHQRLETLIASMPSFSIDRQDSSGRTPLFYACSRDFKPGIELLIKAGADPAHGDNDNVTPLHVSARLGHANTIQYLLKSGSGVIPAEFESDHTSPVWLAANSANPRAAACLDVLLEFGFPANITHDGKHLLHVACVNGRADVVESLLVKGRLDPNVVSREGFTPLHYAVRENTSNDPALVKTLLWAGAYASYPSGDDQRNTPLHLCKQEELGIALVSYGARPEMTNVTGQPATHQLSSDLCKRLTSTCVTRWKLKREVAILFCPNAPYQDASSCRLCKYAFMPILGRKHHCRICGSLVCESCAQKCVTFSCEVYRACDSCFNRAVESKATLQMMPNSNLAFDSPPSELTPSPKELRPSPEPSPPSQPPASNSAARPLTALHERGLALDDLGERSGNIRREAEQFANLADKLAAKFGGK